MLEILNSLDTQLFLSLNRLHSPFFDEFMFSFSDKWVWVPFYISILYIFIRNWKKESFWIIPALVLCIVLADQISSGIIKTLVQRPRPSREEELVGLVHIVKGYQGGLFGFVSSHAANSFGLALFCSLLFKRKVYTWILFLWASVTAYSRIYLGVHYPGDILGGIVVGLFSASFCFFLLKKFRPAIVQKKLHTNNDSFLLKQENYLPLWLILFTTLGITVYSFSSMY